MQLLSDIINELIDLKQDLANPMLKTKALAVRIGNNELLNWVNKEINGYGVDDILPDYRTTYTRVTMSYLNGGVPVQNQPVPMSGMSQNAIRLLTKGLLPDSIATLASFNLSDTDNRLSFEVSAELVQYVENHLKKSGHNRYLSILNISKETTSGVAAKVLLSVRNHLLDLMLEVEKTIGSETTIESLRAASKQITTIMYNIITNTGDGNVINTGDQAKLDTTISIKKGDMQTLVDKLTKLGVSESDTTALVSVLETEEVDPITNLFGPKVNEWIGRMLGKALDGSWQIGVGTAGGVLAEMIKAYYGLGR